MSRDWRLYLADIVERADRALAHVQDLTYDEFATDARTQDAVILNIMLVGEAAKRVPAEIRARAPEVAWQGAARMRDRLVHGYETTDLRIVWNVLSQDLVPIRDGVSVLLAQLDAESDGSIPPPDP